MNSTLQNPNFTAEQLLLLAGQCGYRIESDRVFINIDEIANNRSADNRSGTLALELWALPQPYQGEDFAGFATASTGIGEIQGQYCLRNCHYELNFQQPPAGDWWLVLMLREWQDNAYITRDFINFAAPYQVVASKPPSTRSEKANVIAVVFGETPARQEKPKSAKAVAKPEQPAAKPAQPKVADKRLSVNQALLKELETVKGISKKLAKNIFDNRPYRVLEDLLKVKGMGRKLLQRLEDKITL